MRHTIVLLAAWFVVPLAAVHAQSPMPARPAKKLIEYGWDVPYPDQVRKEIRAMERRPFDGIIFRLREWNHAFDPRPWDETQAPATARRPGGDRMEIVHGQFPLPVCGQQLEDGLVQ